MKTKITLLICFLTFNLAYTQYDWTKGTIVLKNKETLEGLVKLPMVSKNLVTFNSKERVQFKKNKKAKKIKYDESQIDKVIFKHSDTETAHFKYIPVSKKKKGLFKIISLGKATLYARNVSVTNSAPTYMPGAGPSPGTWNYWNYSYSNFNEFYVIRKGEKIAKPLITLRISRSFKKRAMEYFSDCPSLVNKLKDKTYRKEDIKEVIEIYNKCK